MIGHAHPLLFHTPRLPYPTDFLPPLIQGSFGIHPCGINPIMAFIVNYPHPNILNQSPYSVALKFILVPPQGHPTLLASPPATESTPTINGRPPTPMVLVMRVSPKKEGIKGETMALGPPRFCMGEAIQPLRFCACGLIDIAGGFRSFLVAYSDSTCMFVPYMSLLGGHSL